MPEGPSIVILKEQASPFLGKTIARVEGNTTIEKERLQDVDFSLRVHFMLFGSYRIDERKSWAVPRLALGFDDGRELNFYTCSVRFIEANLSALRHSLQQGPPGDHAEAQLLLREMPGALQLKLLLSSSLSPAGRGSG